ERPVRHRLTDFPFASVFSRPNSKQMPGIEPSKIPKEEVRRLSSGLNRDLVELYYTGWAIACLPGNGDLRIVRLRCARCVLWCVGRPVPRRRVRVFRNVESVDSRR